MLTDDDITTRTYSSLFQSCKEMVGNLIAYNTEYEAKIVGTVQMYKEQYTSSMKGSLLEATDLLKEQQRRLKIADEQFQVYQT